MIAVLPVAASAADPFLGEWKMNPEKSQFNGRPLPQSSIARFEPDVEGMRYTVETVDADGKGVRNTYRAKFDGKDYPALSAGRTVSRKRIDQNTFEATYKKDGKLTNRDRWAISPDGKTIVVTTTGVDASTKKPYTTSTVYERSRE
jgi:hypothetical protein